MFCAVYVFWNCVKHKAYKKCTIFIIYGNYVNQLSAIKCVNTAIKIKALRRSNDGHTLNETVFP